MTDQPHRCGSGKPKPNWLKVRMRTGPEYNRVRRLVQGMALHTVCEEARCPNVYECWSAGTATFIILGDLCTRNCRFCAVTTGRPAPPDPDEPGRVAAAAARLGLSHLVVTSVTRDDLADGGAAQFAAVIEAVRQERPECTVEVLTPDFRQDPEGCLETVLAARPAIFSHNLETVAELYPVARPGASYQGSLELLRVASRPRSGPRAKTKTSLMLGLGETDEQIDRTLVDAAKAGVNLLALGQYLQPTKQHLPVNRYVTPEHFDRWRERGRELGFLHVESGPLVRSSYHAQNHGD